MINNVRSSKLFLFGVAVIWGFGFILNQFSIDAGMSPSMILFLRFLIGAGALALLFFRRLRGFTRRELLIGCGCGVLLFAGFLLQTTGLLYVTPSTTAFLTSVWVVIVPFLTWAFYHFRPPMKVFLSALLCLGGVFFLSVTPSFQFSMNTGSLLILICAVVFAFHTMTLGWAAQQMDHIKVAFLQIATAAVLSGIYFLLFDWDTLPGVDYGAGLWPVIVMGLVNTAFAYYVQCQAQVHLTPSHTAIILSMESLFCTIFSLLFGYDALSVHILIGGLLLLGAAVLVNLTPADVEALTASDDKGAE
ncbi:DMT family transporter [Zongyangia hominis]|uniref:DMT family transporter n=1 Tax=Zongyangia hominis TaxID=2763677 RepID=A0A926ECC8_9FIRM|nr:DMT family transporter [Zongyangia hominis]MBC8570475.1 DMT family transporter [Zongyangia hominis]